MLLFLLTTNAAILTLVFFWIYSNRWIYKKNEEYIKSTKNEKQEALERYDRLIYKLDQIIKDVRVIYHERQNTTLKNTFITKPSQ